MNSESLLKDLLSTAHPNAFGNQLNITQNGVNALLKRLQEQDLAPERIDRPLVDECICHIDRCLSEQLDEIMHNDKFQALESSWRNLKYVVDQTNFRENIKVDCLNVSKEDLYEDFADSPEIHQSGLYHWVYSTEYAQFGGEPYAAMIGDYQFSHQGADLNLLKNIAGVAAMSHAPFIASAAPTFFGIDNITALPNLKDIEAIFAGQAYAEWHSFRQKEEARYIGLTVPRFMLRRPYDPDENPSRSFIYKEQIKQHDDYLWGNTSFALATRLTDSFARYRWCPNIIGPQGGGTVSELPLHHFKTMGELETQIPTEVLLSDRREIELAAQGFIPLTFRKGSDEATFFSANSIQQTKNYGISEQGQTDTLNQKIGAQLPYLFVISRVAHYLKVLQREQLGTWKEAPDLERELNHWLNQYVANQDHAPAEIRSRKPLRQGQIKVNAVADDPGWYQVDISVRPHFKYMGSDITLQLSGRYENRESH